MRDQATSSFRVIRVIILVTVAVGLLFVLVSRRFKAREAAERRAQQAAAAQQQFVKDYDNPKGRAEKPLDTPDYLGEPGFEVVGHTGETADAAYDDACATGQQIRELMRERAAAFPPRGFALPHSDDLPTRRDVSKRYEAFRMRELDAYRKLTSDEGEVKAAGERFLEAYIRHALRAPEAPDQEAVLQRARTVLEMGTRDPLVRSYAAFTEYSSTGNLVAAEEVWSETIQQLRESEYPRIVHVSVRMFAWEAGRRTRVVSDDRRHALAVAVVRWLEEETRNPEWADCVHIKLAALCEEDPRLRDELVSGCMNSGRVDPFVLHWLTGLRALSMALHARGAEWATETTPLKWEHFEEHVERAATHLQYAWFLRPNSPYPPAEMITLAQCGYASDYRPFDWFLRSVEAHLEHAPAYDNLLMAFLPRWGGRLEYFEQFSRACLETNRFDTFVPCVFLDVLDFVRECELKESWTQLEQIGASELANEFVKRRARYRSEHPDAEMPAESGFYRTRLALLLEHLGRPDDALAEFRLAGDGVDAHQIQYRNRPGRHLLRLLYAAQGDVRDRVLAFDRNLRQRWPANTDPAQIQGLEQELAELRSTAADEGAQEYYRHAERTLEHLKAWLRGEWVELDLAGGGLGWEVRADTIDFDEDHDELVMSRASARTPHVWARPLAHLESPLTVEAELGHVAGPAHIERVGIEWVKPDIYSANDWDLKQPFVGLHAKSGILRANSSPDGVARGTYSEMVNCSSAISGAYEQEWTQAKEPGLRRVRWNLWKRAYDVRVHGFTWAVQLPEGIADEGVLAFGEPYPLTEGRDLREQAGKWRLASVRVRRLTLPPPPPDDAPFAERQAYWSGRVAADAADALARLKVCEIHLSQEAFAEVVAQSEALLQESPELKRVERLRGMALLRLRRYAEARDALKLALDEPFDDMESILAAATIASAAPDDTLRDGQQAVRLATFAKRLNYNPDENPLQSARVHAVLAAAYAETGDFQQARELNSQALKLADAEFEAELRNRQNLYESDKPFRLPATESDSRADEP
jgi:tetratricopeptide (TPR) repeat protein